jgi:hypothetical protein
MKAERPLKVVFFKTETGNEPVREWLKELSKELPRRFQWNECLRPPSPFILSPGRGNGFRWCLVVRMSVRLIQSYKFSKERRTILPLLGVRADVILAPMMS